MTIIGARVDGRLVHGQVANLWTTSLRISRIMVVDDKASESQIEKAGLRMATPTGVKLSVLPVERALENIVSGKYDEQRLLIVARKPQVFLQLIEGGVELQELNVGNMMKEDGTRAVTNSIYVNDGDVQTLKALNAKGVKLIAQMVPGDKAADLMSLLEKGE